MVLCMACGSADTPAPTTPAGSTAADGNEESHPPLKLGHFGSADGSIGFVLDLTSEPPKLQHDKSKDVIELTRREDRHGQTIQGHFMHDPSGKIVLYISTYGGVKYHGDGNGLPVARDADAKPLGAPTVKGQWVPPKSSYDLASEKYTPISVVAKLGMKVEDSGDLTKVAAAIDKADASMLVHYVWTAEGGARYKPASGKVGDTDYGSAGYYPSADKWTAASKGLAAHGAKVEAQNGRPKVHLLKDYKKELPPNTPGLVWNVDGATVVFVTLDGGRYHLDISGNSMTSNGGEPLKAGLPAVSAWPDPIQHALITEEDLRLFDKAKINTGTASADYDKASEGYVGCVAKLNKEEEAEVEKLEQANMDWSTRSGKIKAVNKKYDAMAADKCGSHLAAAEATILKLVNSRIAERTKIYAKAKAKHGK